MPKTVYGTELLQVLTAIFDRMDTNGNGEITTSEMSRSFNDAAAEVREEGMALDEKAIERIVDYFDMNVDGEIDKDEFTSAGMLMMVKTMFDIYDVNNNGTLSTEEFDVLMDELGYNAEERKTIFNQADKDKDGTIDEMEFYQALMFNVCVDHIPNRIKLSLSQLDVAKVPSLLVFDVVDKRHVGVSQECALVTITLWVQREEKKFYKAEFPIKLSNKEEVKSDQTDPEKKWEKNGVSFDLDDFFFHNSKDMEPTANVQVAGLVEMGDAEDVTIGVRIPVKHEDCAATDANCWELALPLRIQTMENWHKERLYKIASKVITKAGQENDD